MSRYETDRGKGDGEPWPEGVDRRPDDEPAEEAAVQDQPEVERAVKETRHVTKASVNPTK